MPNWLSNDFWNFDVNTVIALTIPLVVAIVTRRFHTKDYYSEKYERILPLIKSYRNFFENLKSNLDGFEDLDAEVTLSIYYKEIRKDLKAVDIYFRDELIFYIELDNVIKENIIKIRESYGSIIEALDDYEDQIKFDDNYSIGKGLLERSQANIIEIKRIDQKINEEIKHIKMKSSFKNYDE